MMKFNILQMFFLMNLSLINLMINIMTSQNKYIHPILMMIMLLLMCMILSFNIELYNSFNWISYLMFLIIVGGLMIIFLYFTSFINNMLMILKWNFIKFFPVTMMLMILFLMILIFAYNKYFPWFHLNLELNLFYIQLYNKIMTMYMYMYMYNYSMIICMIYLLIILSFILKICINKKLTLRKIN